MFSMRESRFISDSFVEGDTEHEEQVEVIEETDTKVKSLADKESRNVRLWRYLVILVLLAAGGTASALTFKLLHDEEEGDFETSVSCAQTNRQECY